MVDLGAPVLQLASARGSPRIRAPFTELGVTQTGSHRSGGHTVSSTQAGNKQGKKKSFTTVISLKRSASRTFHAQRHDAQGSKGPEVSVCPVQQRSRAVVTRCRRRRRPPGALGCRGDGSQCGVSFQIRSLSRVGCVGRGFPGQAPPAV